MLDRSSPLPLYHQLKERLVQRIGSGVWAPETRLPSERELCDLFGISRITVRQALDQLVAEGRLVRSHGRGTFVALSPVRKHLLPLVGFSEDMSARGLRPGARVVRFESAQPPAAVARELQLGAGQTVVVLKRVRLADGAPMAVEAVHAPERLVPGLLDENLEDHSFYELLLRRYGIRPARASQSWQAVPCPRPDAKLLRIRTGSPVLQICRTTYDSSGRPFEYLESFFRGDRYIYYSELREGADQAVPPAAALAQAEKA
jgi:GntR family transcriptional regulator, N-acetylglucosamine utilization regulator